MINKRQIEQELQEISTALEELKNNNIPLLRMLAWDERLDDYIIDIRTKLEDAQSLIEFINYEFVKEEK